MAHTILPFEKLDSDCDHGPGCSLNFILPRPLLEACAEKDFLSDYLHCVPMGEIGIPDYYPKLSRRLGRLKKRNLIYPTGGGLFVHIYPDPKGARDLYIAIEPDVIMELSDIMEEVEDKLADVAEDIGAAETEEEKEQAILASLDQICITEEEGDKEGNGEKRRRRRRGGDDGRIRVTPKQLEVIKYLVVRDKIGLGILEPMLLDPYIEDISCSGVGFVFIEHKIFESLKSTLFFPTLDDLDQFVIWLGERVKKPVTARNPIVDAVLSDGSRINIVYGRDITRRGSNFTIRKFGETPLSIMELIDFGTLDYTMAAYLSMVIEEGLNVFICGGTASGKTTTLNAVTTFVLADSKIVSIEDTPELQCPHPNWIREVTRGKVREDSGGSVSMFDFLKTALRQRPDRIIIGEIRGIEGSVAFQAMQTGHGVMSTFHAASVEKLIQRLTGEPINIPKTYVDNLDVVVVQASVRGPDGKLMRRVLSVNEIVGYDPIDKTFSFIEVFRWNPSRDIFEFPGYMNSYIMEEKIALRRGLPPHKKKAIYTELKRRARVFERLHKEKGVKGFYEFFRVLAEAQRQNLI